MGKAIAFLSGEGRSPLFTGVRSLIFSQKVRSPLIYGSAIALRMWGLRSPK
ncbi:MAG: hypothetical protein KME31_34375 [Tolypothrix carrinoi HA7290-LM1]|nr:hypothetical protein [Tolypothrix carrinoi HA7290-LM1]